MKQHFRLLGTGSDLPGPGVSASELETRLDLPQGWIERHTGVETRYECTSPDTLETMARNAILRAMEDAALTWNEIDLVIDCSTSRHQPIPCNAAVLQSLFLPQAQRIPCMDVHSTCLGFLVGLNVANALFAAGSARRILLVASEAPLRAANPAEPESSTLLSDGAAAVILEQQLPHPGYGFRHETWAEHLDECQVRGGGHRMPAFEFTRDQDREYRFHMDGPRLFRTALRRLPPMIRQLFLDRGMSLDEVLFIPHQASPHGVEAIRKKLGVAPERFLNRSRTLGNMAAASIPVVLDQCRRSGDWSNDQPICLVGTSAGYSQAALVFMP